MAKIEKESSSVIDNPNIGSIDAWGYQPESNRVKGFFADHVTAITYPDFRRFIELGWQEMQKTDATRVIGRALIKQELIRDDSLLDPLLLEAALPLDGRFADMALCYFGNATQVRQVDPGLDAQFDQIIAQTEQEEFGGYWSNAHTLPDGFVVAPLDGNLSEFDLEELARIYATCFTAYLTPMDIASLRQLYSSPDVIAWGVRNPQGSVVSAVSAEMVDIPTSRGTFRLAEIGDEATSPQFRRKGLSTALRAYAIVYLINNLEIDALVIEANALSLGANKNNQQLGLKYCGREPFNCLLVADPSSETISRESLPISAKNFSPLNVWGAPAGRLRQFITQNGELS